MGAAGRPQIGVDLQPRTVGVDGGTARLGAGRGRVVQGVPAGQAAGQQGEREYRALENMVQALHGGHLEAVFFGLLGPLYVGMRRERPALRRRRST
jgi:hypothetical protein